MSSIKHCIKWMSSIKHCTKWMSSIKHCTKWMSSIKQGVENTTSDFTEISRYEALLLSVFAEDSDVGWRTHCTGLNGKVEKTSGLPFKVHPRRCVQEQSQCTAICCYWRAPVVIHGWRTAASPRHEDLITPDTSNRWLCAIRLDHERLIICPDLIDEQTVNCGGHAKTVCQSLLRG